MIQKIRIWDLPTRIFHWLLALTTVGLVVSGQLGGSAMEWHFRAGYLMACLLLFRLAWGVMGGTWSRFANFSCSPKTLVHYVRHRGTHDEPLGHNPLGSLSVVVILALLIAQVASGLAADDEIGSAGPLSAHISSYWVDILTRYHKGIGRPALLAMIGLHLAAIAYYRWRGQDLIRPMVTGDKLTMDTQAVGSQDNRRSRLLAAAVAGLCVLSVLAVGSQL